MPLRVCVHKFSGFTIVEMIVVITLLAILGTVAIARLTGPSAFDPLLLRDYLLAQNAYARRVAMHRQDVDVRLVLDRNVSGIRSTVFADSTLLVERQSETSASVTVAGVPLAVGETLTIHYDGVGYVIDAAHNGSGLAFASGINLVVSDLQMCLYPSGLAEAGSCV